MCLTSGQHCARTTCEMNEAVAGEGCTASVRMRAGGAGRTSPQSPADRVRDGFRHRLASAPRAYPKNVNRMDVGN